MLQIYEAGTCWKLAYVKLLEVIYTTTDEMLYMERDLFINVGFMFSWLDSSNCRDIAQHIIFFKRFLVYKYSCMADICLVQIFTTIVIVCMAVLLHDSTNIFFYVFTVLPRTWTELHIIEIEIAPRRSGSSSGAAVGLHVCDAGDHRAAEHKHFLVGGVYQRS